MELTVKAENGHVEIRTERRADNRWASEYRYVPNHGSPSEWTSASSPEGFISVGMAMSAAILLGKHAAEERAAKKMHTS
jgi:hypothetical protein